MTAEQYNNLMNHILAKINDGVVLMTEEEEYHYKKDIVNRIVRDLQYWLQVFPFMHLTG